MHNFADVSYLDASDKFPFDLGLMEEIPNQELFRYFLGTWEGEEVHKDPGNRQLWSPIVNTGDDETDEKNRNEGRARFTSTRHCLVDYAENDETHIDRFKFVTRRALLDVWLGILVRLIGLEECGLPGEKLVMPASGGRFLITGKGCPRQVPHNDFPVPPRDRKDQLPGYFVIANGDDPFPIWVCPGSHKYVFSKALELDMYAKTMKLKKVIVPPRSVFIGHGHVQHAGAGHVDRVVSHTTTRYHTYFRNASYPIPDNVSFGFIRRLGFEEEVIANAPRRSARQSQPAPVNVRHKTVVPIPVKKDRRPKTGQLGIMRMKTTEAPKKRTLTPGQKFILSRSTPQLPITPILPGDPEYSEDEEEEQFSDG